MSVHSYFDEQKWERVMSSQYDWYRIVQPEFEAILAQYEVLDESTRKEARDAIYGFVETFLRKEKVLLGASGKDWDAERKPIDTIVIHHTKVESGITWERLSAMHLLRLYARAYLAPTTEKEIKGKPVWSNHFRITEDGTKRVIFYAYHWLVREDGSAERLLRDEEIGWQAGNWDVNCRSVGICFDGDFEHSAPPEVMIEGVRKIIREQYPHVDVQHIIPHCNTNPKTTCPGVWFDEMRWGKLWAIQDSNL